MDPTSAFAEIIKVWGPFGAVIVLLVLALISRDKSYREVQEKRILEAQANTERFLVATNANTAATNAAAEGFKALAQSNTLVKDEVTKLTAQKAGRR